MQFPTIACDPPWDYKTPGGGPLQSGPTHRPNSWDNELAGAGSVKRYGKMSHDELAALPIRDLSAGDAHLYLWTTNAFMCQAHDLARAWGFRPITIITWVKVKKAELKAGELVPSRKSGYYFRGATEHVIFGVRGSLPPQTKEAWPTAIISERLPHSVKPDEFYAMAEDLSPGPRLELFARCEREGWERWGDEVESTVELVMNPFAA